MSMKPRGKVRIEWSANFAYAIGLLVTDGSLSIDGRHILLVSKDKEQTINFMKCLGIKNKIGKTNSGHSSAKKYLRVQFGDVLFYRFLVSIGLKPNKTKTIGDLGIPEKYFFDFLRGHHDGDGSFYAYWDPRWKSSYMFYLTFLSASLKHMEWMQSCTDCFLGVRGRITKARSVYQLRYAKKESLLLLKKMYYSSNLTCLGRKRKKIERALKVEGILL